MAGELLLDFEQVSLCDSVCCYLFSHLANWEREHGSSKINSHYGVHQHRAGLVTKNIASEII